MGAWLLCSSVYSLFIYDLETTDDCNIVFYTHIYILVLEPKNIHKWLKGFEYAVDQKDAEILIRKFKDNSSPQSHSFFEDIWQHKIFIAYCTIQLYLWTCDNFIYFGLSLYSTHLAGNAYANYLLLGLVELPAYIVGPVLLTMLGRRFVVAGAHFLAALCFLVPMFADADSWLSLCCWVLGKFAISCSFMSLFVYASEVFPTPIRNGCVGLCSMLSRSGAIAAPYIKLLGSIWELWPMILLAALSFVATILTCFLPETKRKPLPSSVVEATPCSTNLSR
ncbi:unnamed protein product [Cylicostephanus goldi]|uniref:Uncharacterized protein n=1 Tax=Cylicostephanus goldi TaxID=71465 RepID=A0A3P6QXJ6_CYLGO|nr:unnamed protein product [Cylicostephanus goldi]